MSGVTVGEVSTTPSTAEINAGGMFKRMGTGSLSQQGMHMQRCRLADGL